MFIQPTKIAKNMLHILELTHNMIFPFLVQLSYLVQLMTTSQIKSTQNKLRFLQKSNLDVSQIRASQISFLQLRHINSIPVKSQNKLCQICQDSEVSLKDQCPFRCNHHIICQACLVVYADHCLQQNNQLKCPKPNCHGILNQNKKILQLFPKNLQELINYHYLKGQRKYKNNVRCSKKDCYGFINNGTCSLCLTNFCENCYQKEHRGKCSIEDLGIQNIKQCPNCGQGIQKDGGCLEITCRCQHKFCFKCLQDWSKSHHFTCGTGERGILDFILEIFQ